MPCIILSHGWGLRVECFVRVEGYRGNGEVGIGEGELGMVLGRWFVARNRGKGV
ncbi:hypothetical protein Tco_0484318, partial [Tanacetum coccineum]